jgi:hypothetical protein
LLEWEFLAAGDSARQDTALSNRIDMRYRQACAAIADYLYSQPQGEVQRAIQAIIAGTSPATAEHGKILSTHDILDILAMATQDLDGVDAGIKASNDWGFAPLTSAETFVPESLAALRKSRRSAISISMLNRAMVHHTQYIFRESRDLVLGQARSESPRARLFGDPQQAALKLSVNGVLKQDGHAKDMIFSVAEQIATASRIMTLDPGDVLLTGTPAGVGVPHKTFLSVGDKVDAEIAGVGKLSVAIGPSR